jgi:hypothetical protein
VPTAGQPAELRYGAFRVERGAASCRLTRDPLNRTAANADLLGDRQQLGEGAGDLKHELPGRRGGVERLLVEVHVEAAMLQRLEGKLYAGLWATKFDGFLHRPEAGSLDEGEGGKWIHPTLRPEGRQVVQTWQGMG